MLSLDEIRRGLGVRAIPNTSLTTFGGTASPPPRQAAAPRPSAPSRPVGVRDDDLQKRIQAFASKQAAQQQAAQPKQEDTPWYKKALGAALGNPIAQTVMQPLDWLATGGRAAVAGVENAARALPDSWESGIENIITGRNAAGAGLRGPLTGIDESRELEGNWLDRATTSNYGYGTAMESTGNKWMDRAIGFSGDVALDPLTYMTFGSAQAAGKGGRLKVAAKAAAAGASDDTVKRLATRGVAGFSDAERALWGVEKSAIRFAGAELPKTGGIARTMGRGTSKVRSAVTNSRPWQKVARTPDGMLGIDLTEAYKALNTAKYTGSMTPTAAAALIDLNEGLKLFKKSAAQPALDSAGRLFDGKSGSELEQMFKNLEAGDFSELREINRTLFDEATRAGVKLGNLGEDFGHHMWTQEGRDLLEGAEIFEGSTKIDPLGASSTTRTRGFRGGEYTINGEKVNFGKGTADEINREMKRVFGIEKALQDNARDVTSSYINKITNDIAIVKAFNEAVQKHPNVFNWLDTVGDEVLDVIASKTANDDLAKVLRDEIKLRNTELGREVERAKVAAAELQASMVNRFVEDAEAAGGLPAKFSELVKDLKTKGKSLDDLGKAAAKRANTERVAAQKQLAELEGQLAKAQDKITAAQVEMASASTTKERLAAFNEFVQTKARLQAEIEDGRAAVAEIEARTEEFGVLLDTLKQLEKNAADPDFQTEMVQQYAQVRTREVQRMVFEGEKALDSTRVRLDEVERRILDLRAQSDDWSTEATRREDIVESFEQGIEAAMRTEAEALEAVEKLKAGVNQSRAQRQTPGQALLTAVDPARRVNGPKTALLEGQGVGKAESEEIAKILSRLDDSARAISTKKPEATAAAKSLRDTQDRMALAGREVQAETERLGWLDKANKRYTGRMEAAKKELATTRREQPGWSGYKQEVQMAEVEKHMHNMWIVRGEITNAKLRRTAARKRLNQSPGSTKALDELQELTAQHRNLEAVLDEAIEALPPAEAKLMRAYDELAKAREMRRTLEAAAEATDRRWARADRLGSNEAQIRALEETRDILARMVDANPNFKAGRMETFVEDVGREVIPPRAQVEAQQAALPSPVPLTVSKDRLKPITKVYFETPLKASDMKKGVAFKDPEIFRAAPPEVRQRWNAIKSQVQQLANKRTTAEQAPLLEEATRLAEFAHRYKAGLDAGLPAGDELAARVTREMSASKVAKLNAEAKRLREALAQPGLKPKKKKELERVYKKQFENLADDITAAQQRLGALRRQLKKLGGADVDAKFRQELRQDLQIDSAASERATITFLIRETKEDLRNLNTTLGEMIKAGARTADNATGVSSRARGGYSLSKHTTAVAKGHVIPREGDKIGKAIAFGSKAEAEQKAAYYKEISDGIRGVVRKGETVADAKARQDRIYDMLWRNAQQNERLMGRLTKQVEDELADVTRQTRIADRQWSALGKGKGSSVREDWRGVLLSGRGDELGPKRDQLARYADAYDQTDENLGAMRETLLQDMRDNSGQRRAQLPAAQRLPEAEAELAAMPATFKDAMDSRRVAAQDELAQNVQGASTIAQQIEVVEQGLRDIDAKVADEYRNIDALRAVNDNMLDTAGKQLEQAKSKVEQLTKLRKRTEMYSATKDDVDATFKQLNEIVEALKGDNSPEMAQIFANHAAFAEQMLRVNQKQMTVKQQEMFLKRAKEGKLTNVFKFEAKKGWRAMNETFGSSTVPFMNADGMVDAAAGKSRQFAYSDEVAAAFRNLEVAAETGEIAKMFDTMTQLFKTYATATPGFHVRNLISASYMNIVAGVSADNQNLARKAYKAYDADPQGFIKKLRASEKASDRQLADAFAAIHGSGAGGSYDAAELGNRHSWIFDNWWTSKNKRWGEKVEGTVRLGMALDTIKKGGDVRDAMARVSQFHFDYSQISKLDRNIKRLIPFWTFMSNNLVLQMQMMYMRPGMYLTFDKMTESVGFDVEDMPQWLAEKSAFAVGGNEEDGYFGLAPDLPHLDMMGRSAAIDPRNLERAFSQMNPVLAAPVSAIQNKNYYFDRPLTEKDGMGGAADRAMHVLSSIAAPVAQGQRLSASGKYEGRFWENLANFAGIPYRNISPERMEGERRRRLYEDQSNS